MVSAGLRPGERVASAYASARVIGDSGLLNSDSLGRDATSYCKRPT